MLSRSGTKPMTVGEIRKFKIDKNIKKECTLPGEGVIDIEIKKKKGDITQFEFTMVKTFNEVNLLCDDGNIRILNTKGKAEKCGIGRILTELCMKEKNLHLTASADTNEAFKEMQQYIEISKEGKFDEKTDKKLKKLKDWATSYCSKLMYLEMTADPRTGAHVYFNSAQASGFTEMVMLAKLDNFPKMESAFYPNKGPCSVKKLQAQYSNDGFMVKGNKMVDVGGWNWFFCQPKNSKPQPKCTIL